MNNDTLKALKKELNIKGIGYLKVNIIKPAAYFYSGLDERDEAGGTNFEGAEGYHNRKYIHRQAHRSINCYGITNAGILLECLVVDKEYGYDESWDIIAYTHFVEICPLNSIGKLHKRAKKSKYLFDYGGKL